MGWETLLTVVGRQGVNVFHAVLLASTGNPFLVSLSGSVTAAVAWSTMFKERTERLKRDAVPDHVRVYEAIAARNPAAARAAMIALIDLAYTDTAQRKKPRGR
jgi:DNA-binding FadR family transcriptional regulator